MIPILCLNWNVFTFDFVFHLLIPITNMQEKRYFLDMPLVEERFISSVKRDVFCILMGETEVWWLRYTFWMNPKNNYMMLNAMW